MIQQRIEPPMIIYWLVTDPMDIVSPFLVAYGVTYAMGLLTWYAGVISADASPFPNAQMFYPAAGVMLAYLVTRRNDNFLPKWFFLCFLLVSAVSAGWMISIVSLFFVILHLRLLFHL